MASNTWMRPLRYLIKPDSYSLRATTVKAHYAMVRQNFEAALMEVGIEGATAHARLNNTMHGIASLVSEIEAGGGGVGGTA
jgi:hypothetical protein